MKIQVLSDLHHEFYTSSKPPDIVHTDAEVIVLAGDIDMGDRGVLWAADQADRLKRQIVYVPGNHEYYGTDLVRQRERWLVLAEGTGVHVLDDRAVTLYGVRFIGSTLWTDYRAHPNSTLTEALAEAKRVLEDHRVIRYKGGRFSPENALELHRRSRTWLEGEISRPYEGQTVVVTHHGSAACAQHPQFPLSPLSAAFWSDLSSLMDPDHLHLWIYGHTHWCVDTLVNDVRVVSNQYGYHRHEHVPGFRPDFVIEI